MLLWPIHWLLGLPFAILRFVFRRRHRRPAVITRMYDDARPGASSQYWQYIVFDAQGKRVRLHLQPWQVRPFLRHHAEGDSGMLTYRGSRLIDWKPAESGRRERRPTGKQVFISYSNAEYYEDVQWLADVLRSHGLDVYYDRRLIEPGMPLQESIDQAIRNVHIFVPIFGKDYLKSPWCMYELQLAASAGTRVAPVTVEDRTSIPRDVTQFLRKHLGESLYLDMRARHAPKKVQQFAANLAS